MAKKFNNIPDRETMRQNYEGLYANAGEAISEFIENGFDYREKIPSTEKPGTVYLIFENNNSGLFRIAIADDGRGMDVDSMGSAMQIVRQVQKNGSSGAYGTGMKSAMDYLSAKPCLISKKNGKLTWVFQNSDKWEITVCEEGDENTKIIKFMWNEYAVNPDCDGTVMVLSDLKRGINIKEFKKKLAWKYHQKVNQKNVNIYIGEKNA